MILCGFKKSEDTFEEEFAMIEEMHKQRINRTPSMILGVEDDQLNKDNNDEKDKYNLDSVTKYNDKNYVPLIKKELTIIPESDISREDSIYNEELLIERVPLIAMITTMQIKKIKKTLKMKLMSLKKAKEVLLLLKMRKIMKMSILKI